MLDYFSINILYKEESDILILFLISLDMFYLPLILTFLYSDKEIKNVQSTVNKELDKIYGWLCTNKLSINRTKTISWCSVNLINSSFHESIVITICLD